MTRKYLMNAALMVAATLGSAILLVQYAQGQRPAPLITSTMDDDGTVHIPAITVPLSSLMSPELKASLVAELSPRMNPAKRGTPNTFMAQALERSKARYPLDRVDTKIGGVHVYDYRRKEGIPEAKRNRVLIDLHGGGFSGCWPLCAESEAIPIAYITETRVVAVDYREAPENHFPAASEDVAKVYSELLKTYRPENIAIYGCSAGGRLTAMSVAWFQTHNLPRPGAAGILCAAAGGGGPNDGQYLSSLLGEGRVMPSAGSEPATTGYFAGVPLSDPMYQPINSSELMAKFPPTVIVTGTRAMEMSTAIHTHARLVELGVEADLHVIEGGKHAFWYDPVPPESQHVYKLLAKFFDRHLGNKPLQSK